MTIMAHHASSSEISYQDSARTVFDAIVDDVGSVYFSVFIFLTVDNYIVVLALTLAAEVGLVFLPAKLLLLYNSRFYIRPLNCDAFHSNTVFWIDASGNFSQEQTPVRCSARTTHKLHSHATSQDRQARTNQLQTSSDQAGSVLLLTPSSSLRFRVPP